MSLSISRHSRSSVRSLQRHLPILASLMRSCSDWGRGALTIASRVRRMASLQRSSLLGRAASVKIRVAPPSARMRVVRQTAHGAGPPREMSFEHRPLTHRGQMASPNPQSRHRVLASEQRIRGANRRSPHPPKTPTKREVAREPTIVLTLEHHHDIDQIEQAPQRLVCPAVPGEQNRVRGWDRPEQAADLGGARPASAPTTRPFRAERAS